MTICSAARSTKLSFAVDIATGRSIDTSDRSTSGDLGPVALVDVVVGDASTRAGPARPRCSLSAASAAARSVVRTVRPPTVIVTAPVAGSRSASSSSSAVATRGCLALRILPDSTSRSARRRSPGIPDGVDRGLGQARRRPSTSPGYRQISATNPAGLSVGMRA